MSEHWWGTSLRGFLFLAILTATGVAEAQDSVATFVYPSAGATTPRTPVFEWTPVADAESYYLLVGTFPGGADLVDSGELQEERYAAAELPDDGRTLHARIYTRFAGVWRFSDTTFTVASVPAGVATFIYPTNGAVGVPTDGDFRWTAVAEAQAYYLYVGTSRGAKDSIDTGEIPRTSHTVSSLPAGRTLFARIWTKSASGWQFADAAFTVAAAGAAQFIEPLDGAVWGDPSQSFRWTAVPGALAYYLYVGTARGAKDLIDTGEIQQTLYRVPPLPAGSPLYARIWTKLDTGWQFADATFTVPDLAASFLEPVDGAEWGDDRTRSFRWTTVPGALAYYLYVGTTRGAKDLVNTGEIPQTFYPVPVLPAGRLLYARIWTKLAGGWRLADATFTVPGGARLLDPVEGTTWNDRTRPFRWTSVAGATAYYLYVGTTRGAKDLVDTGEIQQTSYSASILPFGRTLYARIWTKFPTAWAWADVTFTIALEGARFLNPVDRAVNVDISQPFRWTAPADAQAYRLTVGSALGASDLLNTGEIRQTAFTVPVLPVGPTLYARLWTRFENEYWTSADVTFTAAAIAASFVHPTHGAINVDLSRAFQWTTVSAAQAYRLFVGSTPGGSDLVSTPEILQTTYSVPGLPSGRVLYARIWTKTGGVWRYEDAAFAGGEIRPQLLYPTAGTMSVDTTQPFRWSRMDVASAYRLEVGISYGRNDLHDSGEIKVPRRFVGELPIGVPLYGRLSARIGGVWSATDFTFVVSQNGASMAVEVDSTLWTADLVRAMADDGNYPYRWTELYDFVHATGMASANCAHYAQVLLSVLGQMNLTSPARILNVCFTPNSYDCHTLVELWNSDQQEWMVVDPTFSLAARRARDGGWATALDLSAATVSRAWTDISYVALGSAGDVHARAYYLDYPLLFLNLYQLDANYQPERSSLPYLDEVPLPIVSQTGLYILRSAQPGYVDVTINGQPTVVPCTGFDSLSSSFYATSIAAPAGNPDALRVYRPRRFVF